MLRCPEVVARHLRLEPDPSRRELLTWAAQQQSDVLRALPPLPTAVVHSDANEHNVVLDEEIATLARDMGDAVRQDEAWKAWDGEPGEAPAGGVRVIDFGDTMRTAAVAEVAVAAAYAMMRRPHDCMRVLHAVVGGFCSARQLSVDEIVGADALSCAPPPHPPPS